MKVKAVMVLVALSLASTVLAAENDEMRKLDFMLGEWSGEGSMRRGPGEPDVSLVHEKVQSRAGGRVLLIEGRGHRKLADGAAGDVVHDALGVVWWDPSASKYRFSAFTGANGHADATFELVGERNVVWGLTTPQGQVRYTIRMDEKDTWNEIGEYSRDGKQWAKFFEMNLTKK